MGDQSRGAGQKGHAPGDYTLEELQILASLRRSTGRTCTSCAWFKASGNQRGCFPEGRYRKWLSSAEFEAGCEIHESKEKKA